MNFETALKGMRKGGLYRLPHWFDHISITIRKGELGTIMFLGDGSFSFGFSLSSGEITSEKWYEVFQRE
ncbi:MAG: hypothetical protein IMZ64_12980 [Bacteroidetes bacterium]|nr:hypothetical protein [Bacteroidota bacterium]